MTKSNAQKQINVPQKHLHSRISFLYQAATYLASAKTTLVETTSMEEKKSHQTAVWKSPSQHGGVEESSSSDAGAALTTPPLADFGRGSTNISPAMSIQKAGLSRQMLSHLGAVSLKAQIRLSSTIKRSICRRCDTLLVTGSTSHERLENMSRGGRKPWADVIILRCHTCGTEKRIPIGATRQTRKAERRQGETSSFGNNIPSQDREGKPMLP